MISVQCLCTVWREAWAVVKALCLLWLDGRCTRSSKPRSVPAFPSSCCVPGSGATAWSSPTRNASRYRLYDDDAIARLRAMRLLIDDGWAPSTAATHIRELDDAAIEGIVGAAPVTAGAPPRTARAAATAEALADAFVSSAAALDEPGVEQVLDEMFARGSFEQVTSELVMPALVALGDSWAKGKVDVAAEHAAAGAVQRRLGMAFMAAGVPRDQRRHPRRPSARSAARPGGAGFRDRGTTCRLAHPLSGFGPADQGLARRHRSDEGARRRRGRRNRT